MLKPSLRLFFYLTLFLILSPLYAYADCGRGEELDAGTLIIGTSDCYDGPLPTKNDIMDVMDLPSNQSGGEADANTLSIPGINQPVQVKKGGWSVCNTKSTPLYIAYARPTSNHKYKSRGWFKVSAKKCRRVLKKFVKPYFFYMATNVRDYDPSEHPRATLYSGPYKFCVEEGGTTWKRVGKHKRCGYDRRSQTTSVKLGFRKVNVKGRSRIITTLK